MKIRVQLEGREIREYDSDEAKVKITDAGVLVITHAEPRRRVSYPPAFWLSLEEELPEPRPNRVVVY